MTNRVEMSDEQLEQVNGGVRFENGYAINKDTGEKYKLKVDEMTAFMYITGITTPLTEAERIQKLRDKGYI